MSKRKYDTPPKTCAICKTEFTRGEHEQLANFKIKQTCGPVCKQKLQVQRYKERVLSKGNIPRPPACFHHCGLVNGQCCDCGAQVKPPPLTLKSLADVAVPLSNKIIELIIPDEVDEFSTPANRHSFFVVAKTWCKLNPCQLDAPQWLWDLAVEKYGINEVRARSIFHDAYEFFRRINCLQDDRSAIELEYGKVLTKVDEQERYERVAERNRPVSQWTP